MNRKLVIHPKDRSTEFLKHVYEDLDDVTVVTGGVRKETLRLMIDDYDQVIMLGHGSPTGLMSVGQFNGSTAYGNIVDASFYPALSKKDNSIFIWCNADQFVNRGGPFLAPLKGFYTGMFISEVYESYYMKVPADINQIRESNEVFARAVGQSADAHPAALHWMVQKRYGEIIGTNPVAKYNHDRLYVNVKERGNEQVERSVRAREDFRRPVGFGQRYRFG